MSTVAPPETGQLTKEQLLEAYRVMRTIREFEERLHTEFATGEIPGFVLGGIVILPATPSAIAAARMNLRTGVPPFGCVGDGIPVRPTLHP